VRKGPIRAPRKKESSGSGRGERLCLSSSPKKGCQEGRKKLGSIREKCEKGSAQGKKKNGCWRKPRGERGTRRGETTDGGGGAGNIVEKTSSYEKKKKKNGILGGKRLPRWGGDGGEGDAAAFYPCKKRAPNQESRELPEHRTCVQGGTEIGVRN